MAVTFTAKVKAFADLSMKRAELVVKQSAQDMFEIAQTPKARGGKMPVDTGFLRNSLTFGSSAGPESYVLAVAGMELGGEITGRWTAAYAMRRNYGFVGIDKAGRQISETGDHFATDAAAQWQAIVARNAEKAKALK